MGCQVGDETPLCLSKVAYKINFPHSPPRTMYVFIVYSENSKHDAPRQFMKPVGWHTGKITSCFTWHPTIPENFMEQVIAQFTNFLKAIIISRNAKPLTKNRGPLVVLEIYFARSKIELFAISCRAKYSQVIYVRPPTLLHVPHR
jgi:hypothetical protein